MWLRSNQKVLKSILTSSSKGTLNKPSTKTQLSLLLTSSIFLFKGKELLNQQNLQDASDKLGQEFNRGQTLKAIEDSPILPENSPNSPVDSEAGLGTTNDSLVRQVEEGLKLFNNYTLEPLEFYKEGHIYDYSLPVGQRQYKVLVVKHEQKLFVLGGICPHDLQTELKDGLLYGNKLYCPKHGCAFNIENGEAEYAPSQDNLPIFSHVILPEKDKVQIFLPKTPPKKLKPFLMMRDKNDLRKVVVLGSGSGGMGAAETLRYMHYSGELQVITEGDSFESQEKLTKQIKNLEKSDVVMRDQQFLKDHDIDLMTHTTVKGCERLRSQEFLVTEDDVRIEYDAVVLASGLKPCKERFINAEYLDNVTYLTNFREHEKVQREIKNAKKVTLMGLNFDSLEMAGTIRREYPKVEVSIIDENKESFIKNFLGEEVEKGIVQYYKNRGVNFFTGRQVRNFLTDVDSIDKVTDFEEESDKIPSRLTQFVLPPPLSQTKSKKGKQAQKQSLKNQDITAQTYSPQIDSIIVDTDLVIFFPNKKSTFAGYLKTHRYFDELKFDPSGRVIFDDYMMGPWKRMFAAGSLVCARNYVNNERHLITSHQLAYHQGRTAAYNILGMGYPHHQVSTNYKKLFDKDFRIVGDAPVHQKVHIEGSVENMDFIAYYSNARGFISMAAGSPNQSNKLSIINEAMRLQLLPPFEVIQQNGVELQRLDKLIRDSKRSGCFRSYVFGHRFDPWMSMVIWRDRDRMSNTYYNINKDGKLFDSKEIIDQSARELVGAPQVSNQRRDLE